MQRVGTHVRCSLNTDRKSIGKSAAVIAKYDHGMDLRSIECFVRVAETLHFGRASVDLHLSQPALSQRIRTLEREVGTPLLDRDRRRVKLTAAGQAFLEPARAALAHGDNAVELARRAATGARGRLRLGFTVIASYTRLPDAVQHFRARFPEVSLDLAEMNSPATEEALVRGDIDIGILHPPLTRPELSTSLLPAEPMVLAVPAGHRLAATDSIGFGDLDGEALLAAPRAVGPSLFDAVIACYRAAGVEPRIIQEATPVTTLAGLVAAGAGVGFVTRGVARATRPGVAFIEVRGTPEVPMAAAWLGNQPSPTGSAFVDVLTSVATTPV
jgi:DNA-binding transcriptional LysR family regulator